MKFSARKMKGYLQGPEVEALMYRAGYLAAAMYQSIAPRRTNVMAESAVVDVEIKSPYKGGERRWVATVSVEAPYGVPVEFGHAIRGRVGGKVNHNRRVLPDRALAKTVRAVRL